MIHFFSKNPLSLILFFSIGLVVSCFLATYLSEKFLKYEEVLMEDELEKKVLFFKKSLALEETEIYRCLFKSTSSQDSCIQISTLYKGLSLYDMRVFRNDTLIFEKNINSEIAWSKSQKLESKNSIFVLDLKPTKEHLEFLKPDFPKWIFLLGIFVSSAFTTLIWFYQQLFTKKEELYKARNKIFAVNETLQKKNSELEECVYVVAHDLQEPLNTINGFVEVIKEDYPAIFENKEVEQYL